MFQKDNANYMTSDHSVTKCNVIAWLHCYSPDAASFHFFVYILL